MDFIQNECKEQLGHDLFTIIKMIKDFLPAYKQMNSKTEKQYSLISFIMGLVDTP